MYATSPQDVGPYRQVQLGGQAAGAAAYADAVPSPDSLMARMCQVRNREQGKEGEPLTDVQINSQSFTFILAGEKSGPSPDLHLMIRAQIHKALAILASTAMSQSPAIAANLLI